MQSLKPSNRARAAVLLIIALSSRVDGLPTPKNVLSFFNLGNILHPLQNTVVAPSLAASSDNPTTTSPDPTITVVTQTVFEIVNEFETPSFSQYPNGGSRVVYMGGKEGEMPMPTLQPFEASPFDIVDPILSVINNPLGVLQGSEVQQTVTGTEVVLTDSPATFTGSSQDPQNTEQAAHSTSISGTVVAAYYADWAAKQLAPEDVDFSRFNWVDFG